MDILLGIIILLVIAVKGRKGFRKSEDPWDQTWENRVWEKRTWESDTRKTQGSTWE